MQRKFQVETEVENWIQKFDADMGDRQVRYSLGGSSDAAFRCQYCSDLLTLLAQNAAVPM